MDYVSVEYGLKRKEAIFKMVRQRLDLITVELSGQKILSPSAHSKHAENACSHQQQRQYTTGALNRNLRPHVMGDSQHHNQRHQEISTRSGHRKNSHCDAEV